MDHSPNVNPEVDSTGSLERGPVSKKVSIRIGRRVLNVESGLNFHTSSNADIAIAIVHALRRAIAFNMVMPQQDTPDD